MKKKPSIYDVVDESILDSLVTNLPTATIEAQYLDDLNREDLDTLTKYITDRGFCCIFDGDTLTIVLDRGF